MIAPSILLAGAGLSSIAVAASVPRSFGEPTLYGFPNPNDQQKLEIAQEAGGMLPNQPNPTTLGANSITALQLITANELFEASYFTDLLTNITNGGDGFQANNKNELLEIFTRVRAQEELHALAASGNLKGVGAFAPSACTYSVPVTCLEDAVLLAETFTAVVLGALQGAQKLFAMDGEAAVVAIVSSIIGQEGEQNGFYRFYLDEVPSESPFLTAVPAAFAWSALTQLFTVPGSCPYELSQVNLPIFTPITVNGGPIGVIQPQDQTLSFQVDLSMSSAAKNYTGGDGSGLYMTYTIHQQIPVSVPISNVKFDGNVISFDASFPYSSTVANGFSHGALTTKDSFSTSDDVVNAALAGPAVIQVRDNLTSS